MPFFNTIVLCWSDGFKVEVGSQLGPMIPRDASLSNSCSYTGCLKQLYAACPNAHDIAQKVSLET